MTVYTRADAVVETMKTVPTVSAPVESIEHEDEANNPVGVETIDLHVPTSRGENSKPLVVTRMI